MKLFRIGFLICLFVCIAEVRAESTTGSLTGHVSSEAAQFSLPGVRVGVEGTTLEAFTDQQGNYTLKNVPAGDLSVSFSYVGYPVQAVPVAVKPGETKRLDEVFTEQVVKMQGFVISGDVLGTAKAVNDQRAAPAFENDVASDAIGELPDKNLAESLQRVPGVEISRDKGEGRYVNIRGLDPIYIGASMNGIRMSTAEKGTREEAFDVMSSTFIASIELNKVNTPDMDGDDMGGSVNIKTRSGFDQEGLQETVSIGTNYGHQEDMHGGYNFATNFANQYDNGQVGFALDLASEYRPFTAYTEPGTTWSQVVSPTDGQLHWVLASQDFRHYDAKRRRLGESTGFDIKISDTEKVYVRFLDSDYTESNQQWLTTFPIGGGTLQALNDTSATASIKAGGIIKSMAQIENNKRISSLVSGLNSTVGPWTNDLMFGYTTGKYTRPTVTIAFANSAATVLDYNFNTPYNGAVGQVSGPSIDSPSSYAFSTKSSYSNTTANMHEITVKDSARYDLPDAPNPTFIKLGVEYRDKNNNIDTSKWAITSVPYTLPQITYPGNDTQYGLGAFPNFQIRQEAVSEFYGQQSLFPTTLTASTTYGGAFRAEEDIPSTFAMAGITLGKLKLTAGGRVEMTHFWIDGWQQETPAGSSTVVITPVTSVKNYANFMPDVIAEYEFTPQTIARASWTNTIARPDYSATAPGITVNDTSQTVSLGNSKLDALQAMNWDASLEHYYSPLGLVSAAAFYKSITNFTYNAQAGTDPNFPGYQVTSYYNGPSAWIYGVELNWVQQLSFLPGALRGLGFLANAILGDSQASYPTRPGEKLPFTGFAHKSGNIAITYNYAGFDARVAEEYHGRRMETGSTIGANATQDEYEEPYHTLDASLSYSFGHHWQVYFMGANLNNAPLEEYYGGTGSLHRIQTYEAYGWSGEGGLRWNY